MIKRLIDELTSELSESETAESIESSELIVNSVNSHIIKKILNSDVIDHIFCNRSSFITYTFKISYAKSERERNSSQRNMNQSS